jgi:hypothetical protein
MAANCGRVTPSITTIRERCKATVAVSEVARCEKSSPLLHAARSTYPHPGLRRYVRSVGEKEEEHETNGRQDGERARSKVTRFHDGVLLLNICS